ncbi:hypothetical protein [Pseudoalteromonas tunicata]|uniref:hypothetical protein n=1 Tax=Pseudoalteromonas tunicata TaxID=314281 RepID=UPI00273E8F16|nr:hypothetical protein [Pseudoalteromonas tunicata]MDP4983782.1 hypothetical protein [Pseudoalteromonas tunicata]
MARCLFLIIALISWQVSSNEICDANSKKCAQVGSAAAWMLSIIETSKEQCGANNEISQWLKSNHWLVEQVKANESEYAYLSQMQKRTYWNTNNSEIAQQCSEIVTLIKSGSPLNFDLR